MKIACIYTVENNEKGKNSLNSWPAVPFGIAMIAASLEKAGHEIKVVVVTLATDIADLKTDLFDDSAVDAVCFTAVSSQFEAVKAIAKELKKVQPKVPIILGGHHATLASEDAIACKDIDAICVGEGDLAAVEYFSQLAQGTTPKEVPNFWIKQPDGELIKNPNGCFYPDLDKLPFINRKQWLPWVKDPELSGVILLGRGCPFRCTYCSNHSLKNIAKGRYVRKRTVPNVIEELESLLEMNPKLQSIYFEIETISAFLSYLHELCEALKEFNQKRKVPIKFGVNMTVTSKLARNEDIARKMLAGLQEAGFTFINYGLESGSERIREEILRRPKYTNEEIIQFSNWVDDYKIKKNIFVLIGLPTETVEDFEETKAVTKACKPTQTDLSIFYPYPGTDLYDMAVELKLFDPLKVQSASERKRINLKLPGFSKTRILYEYHSFRRRFVALKNDDLKSVLIAAQSFLRSYPKIEPYVDSFVKAYFAIKSKLK
ncbi:MAG: radical SAM protein [SAR324 cluster bacterium]|nr:radical SAM protein [SAR324 cluster bacterium]